MNNIRFKKTAQHWAEHLVCKQCSFPVLLILFILYGLLKCWHDIQLFEVQDSQSFHKSCQSISSTFSFSISTGFQKLKTNENVKKMSRKVSLTAVLMVFNNSRPNCLFHKYNNKKMNVCSDKGPMIKMPTFKTGMVLNLHNWPFG